MFHYNNVVAAYHVFACVVSRAGRQVDSFHYNNVVAAYHVFVCVVSHAGRQVDSMPNKDNVI
jgi:hypothetical protein